MKKLNNIIVLTMFTYLLISCDSRPSQKEIQLDDKQNQTIANYEKGKLFIIGGGKRPVKLIQELITTSGLDKENYAVILPMASKEPDSAIFYAAKQFTDLEIDPQKIKGYPYKSGYKSIEWSKIIKNAGLIYITGGDQKRFMDAVINTPLYDAIHDAFQNGATIAGTSAGAAIMGKKMITGNEYKHSEYTGDFKTIEADNIEIAEGVGLLKNVIVDQHFIKRMRMNRLMAVAIEHPEHLAIGIDESTAILIQNKKARVIGVSQVILLRNSNHSFKENNGLLGAHKMQIDIMLPGDTFNL
ncbi:cyanophycinase [Aquimarina sp. 2-A2]|uniref:cyanophycinase n=1 Tax=Aquimarina sp. 2-A2 TaxID=3382644 RepID=UPI00387F0A01